ncbi:hypothetical protein [Nannocystis sp.]|uniref:hypothetical protein n=1 Tax=Nannocystis sp. TaxID=1962667 RepID=UPI0025FA730C|nr:hypothetical protein [Nannocystis sp.]MBK7827142.1 hypothetical protein [Nannocystis sp.]
MPATIDIQKFVADIDLHRKRMQGTNRRFTGLDAGALAARLAVRRAGLPVAAPLPMITWQGWSSSTSAGGIIDYTVGIANPSASDEVCLFAHAFVGPANFIADPGMAVQAVDPRFPRLTEPAFAGLQIAAGATASLNFQLRVPSETEPSNYLGNTFLFRADWHDVGTYLDRGFWPFGVGGPQ